MPMPVEGPFYPRVVLSMLNEDPNVPISDEEARALAKVTAWPVAVAAIPTSVPGAGIVKWGLGKALAWSFKRLSRPTFNILVLLIGNSLVGAAIYFYISGAFHTVWEMLVSFIEHFLG